MIDPRPHRVVVDAWMPAGPWLPWVKPLLLTSALAPPSEARPDDVLDLPWPSLAGAALVLDLPGVEAVRLGLAAASRGWAPVLAIQAGSEPGLEVVPLGETVEELSRVQGLAPPPLGAPPAFVLDSRRHEISWRAVRDFVKARFFERPQHDDRWSLEPGDLPLASDLLEHGVTRAVRIGRAQEAWDLVQVLREWREGGVQVEQAGGAGPWTPREPTVRDRCVRWVDRRHWPSTVPLPDTPTGG